MKTHYLSLLFSIICPYLFAQNKWMPVGTGMDSSIKVLYKNNQSPNSMYAGGDFKNASGTAANAIAKFNGTAWQALGSGVDGVVSAMVMNGSKLYVGGGFQHAGGVAASNIAVYDTATSTWSALGSGMNNQVSCLEIFNNELYAGGRFDTVGSIKVNYLAKWNGSSWISVGGGVYVADTIPASISSLASYKGELYAAGGFIKAGTTSVNNIARWNGTTWSALGTGIADSFSVSSLGVKNNILYVGGRFTAIGGVQANNLAKWDGSTWSSVGAGINGTPNSFELKGTSLYTGGWFAQAGGITATNVAMWDGTNWKALGEGLDEGVNAVLEYKNVIYAGGYFIHSGDTNKLLSHIAKWCDVDAQIVASSTTICNGKTATLTASGADTYSWSSGQNTAVISVNPSVTTTYKVFAYRNGCTDTVAITVNVNSLPVVSISGSNSICAGGAITLTASGASTYSWNTAATASSIAVNPSADYTYVVTGTHANGCTASASTAVKVHPLPVVSINPNTTICGGLPVTLGATGGGSYQWSTGSTTASFVVTPSATTNYSVLVTSSFGCTSTASTTITLKSAMAKIDPANPSVCAGNSITLSASGGGTYSWVPGGATTSSIVLTPTVTTNYTVTTKANGCTDTATVKISVGNGVPNAAIAGITTICQGKSSTLTASGGDSYSWNIGGSSASVVVSPTVTTTYSVSVSNAGCIGSATTTVSVLPSPTVVVSNNTTVCSGKSATLTASGGASYLWMPGSLTTSSILVFPSSSTNYVLTATALNGCKGVDSVKVVVNDLAHVAIAGGSTICNGKNTTLTASGGDAYLWSTGASSASVVIAPTSTTDYSVTITNAGCTKSISQSVTVLTSPVVTISGNTTVCKGQSTTLTASGGDAYLWSNSSSATSIIVTPTAGTTSYSVVATSSNSCSNSKLVTVQVGGLYTFSVSITNASCATCTDGKASATPSLTGNYSYSWNSSPAQTSATATGLKPGTYTVCVTDSYNCSSCKPVVIGSPTNVNAVDNHLSIIIAPNPFTTHAMISIEGDDFNNSELIVYDLCGQVVQRKEFDTNHVRLEKQGLVSGVYFMKITNKSKIIGVRKIVIE